MGLSRKSCHYAVRNDVLLQFERADSEGDTRSLSCLVRPLT
jgi:hypothetical protein